MKHAARWLLPLVLALTAFASAQAQDLPPVSGRAGERLEMWRKMRIQEVLRLDEETSVRFFARYSKHTQQFREINLQRNSLVDQLSLTNRSGSSDAERQKLIDKLMQSEEEITHAKLAFLEDLKELLTPRQLASYIVFERDFNKNVRDILRQLAQERIDKRNSR